MSNEKKSSFGQLVGITILFFCGFIYWAGLNRNNVQVPSKPIEALPSNNIAGLMAKDYVLASLKAPSTAEFDYTHKFMISEVEKGLYEVASYVDSENSFGAKIRSNWYVKIRHVSGDAYMNKSWKLEDIKIK